MAVNEDDDEDINLQAEANTDEVFCPITFLREIEESGPDEYTSKTKLRKAFSKSFSKKLTPSDTSTHGGFCVPKRHADECFPPLDMDQESQQLVATDLNGTEWMFRHIYRGQPRRNLITAGWRLFVNVKKLVAGDSLFVQALRTFKVENLVIPCNLEMVVSWRRRYVFTPLIDSRINKIEKIVAISCE